MGPARKAPRTARFPPLACTGPRAFAPQHQSHRPLAHYYQRGIALTPNNAYNIVGMAEYLTFTGRAEEALSNKGRANKNSAEK